ncbi:hypothetical protein X768_14130 [Mesorhizobium sp. LSJC265A00]|nr:hypothetical protein X768_14130 [Mesorhizobium sp. LSJC265A00]ESY99107.1 hypothetical protein X736_33685 [Mesorhizobium sp. L2C089B000]
MVGTTSEAWMEAYAFIVRLGVRSSEHASSYPAEQQYYPSVMIGNID